MNKEQYAAYLASDSWRNWARSIRDDVGVCEECGITDTLNVHHKHYRSLGKERRDDVLVLCERCHYNLHILQKRIKLFGIHCLDGITFIEKRDYVQKEIEKIRDGIFFNKFEKPH